MAWGEPSTFSGFPEARLYRALASTSNSTSSSTHAQRAALILRQLVLLNSYFGFGFGNSKLVIIWFQHVIPAVEHLLAASPVETFLEAYPISCAALIRADSRSHISAMPPTPSTPLLGQFLVAINGFVKAGNSSQLGSYLALEPPFNEQYNGMIQELRQVYPKGQEQQLEARCQQSLNAAADGWSNFTRFMVQYLAYLRDVSMHQSKYLETYEHLLELQSKANSALAQGSSGNMLLQTVITNAKLLCRLAIGLDRKPELMSHLKAGGARAEDSGQRETLPERAANTVRSAFVTCLNDRSETVGNKPSGKQVGIYVLANLCLKILFQCRKTRNATQIFENISNAAPPITSYNKSQRVTYLYYLGRFLFQNSHFYRAHLVLQHAYSECPARPQCVKQRRLILVYLTASNIILGRFPSDALLSTPEAEGFRVYFIPLCSAIRQGNLTLFSQHLAFDSPHVNWFLHYRIFLQLRNRCEVLVWRSLIRKTFQLYGSRPPPESRVAAQLDLFRPVAAFSMIPSLNSTYTDPDLEGAEEDLSSDYQTFDELAMESVLSSLIDQGLVSGYISHERHKLAILGAHKADGDPVKAGFPNVWSVISRKFGDDVPGWKVEGPRNGGTPFAAPAPGMVVNLSGVKPVSAFA